MERPSCSNAAHSDSGLRSRPVVKQRHIVPTLLLLFVPFMFFGFISSAFAQTTAIGLVQANAIQGSGVGSVSVAVSTSNTAATGNFKPTGIEKGGTGRECGFPSPDL